MCVGLLRFLAGLLVVLWLMRAVRKMVAPPAKRGPRNSRGKDSKFSSDNVEEAEYEELP
jgi:hypothetical protein